MVSWGILSNKQIPVKKGTGHTFEYAITKFGKLLALLIETDFNTSKSAFDLLYSFLELYFNEESYSIDYFCKSYLKKCKKAGLFVDFIGYLRKNILYQSKYIANDNDLFTSMIFMTTSDNQLNKKLWKLWNESYNEMDYDLQELFLYHFDPF
jgi:hypothetical protein